MGFANRASIAGGVGLAVSALAGCGGSGGLLSAGQAGTLSGQLAQASSELSAGRCGQAETTIQNLQNSVANLSGVNQTLMLNLTDGANTIARLAQRDCPT